MVVKGGRPMYGSQMLPSNVINVPMRKGPAGGVSAAAVLHRPASAPHPVRAREPVTAFPSSTRPAFKEMPTQSRVSNLRPLDMYPPKKEVHSELECDYDTSATELYELLESSDWERARNRSRTHPEEVRTWIVRKDKNQQVRWRLLPLHAAIIFQSPSFLVSSLLERYPIAASRKDDQGMLPLHLAFRHKQDDEDLLELLLAQYPEAVIMRDRRDRVPLDHGRESRFSSKLMRLYAEAIGSASPPPASQQKVTPTAASQGTTHTANTESLTHTMTHSQMARMEAEHEAKLAVVKADYEYQIKSMQGKYEDRMQVLQEKSGVMVRQAQAEGEKERHALMEQHEEEMNQLRELLARQVSQDRATSESLQQQVNDLQSELHEAKHESNVLAEKYRLMVCDNEELRDFLDRIYEEQDILQDLAGKQQEYLHAARAIRTELVHTLLKQEDQDSENDRLKGTKLMEVASHVKRRISEYVEHRFSPEVERDFLREKPREAEQVVVEHTHPVSERRGLSRIEVEREEGDRIYSDHQGQTEVQAFYVVPGEDARQPVETFREEPVPEVKSADEDYGEVRILADDISAITENSAY